MGFCAGGRYGYPPMNTADAGRVLELGPGPGAPEIEAAFRAQVKQLHPDRGGDDRAVVQLVEARRVLREAARRPLPRVVVVPDEPWWRELRTLVRRPRKPTRVI